MKTRHQSADHWRLRTSYVADDNIVNIWPGSSQVPYSLAQVLHIAAIPQSVAHLIAIGMLLDGLVNLIKDALNLTQIDHADPYDWP